MSASSWLDLTDVAAVAAEAARRIERRKQGLPLHDDTASAATMAEDRKSCHRGRVSGAGEYTAPTKGGRGLKTDSGGSGSKAAPEAWAKLGREFVEQVRLFDWIDSEGVARWPELVDTFAVPNAGMRSRFSGGGMRRAGLRRGVADVIHPVPHGGYTGLAVELKVTGGKVEPEQAALHARWRARGWRVVVVVGYEPARDALVEYVSGRVVRGDGTR